VAVEEPPAHVHNYAVPVATEYLFRDDAIASWQAVVVALACSGCGRMTKVAWEQIGWPFGSRETR
jgi:hypothetical protein